MGQEQFKQEVVPLRGQLLFYAQRLLDDAADAEDIIQEVYLKLWYMRNELNAYNSIPALSVQITKRLCLNRLKEQLCKQKESFSLTLASKELTPDIELEEKDQVSHVMRIIDTLPGLQQTILRMRHVDGFEVEEIAELTGSNPEAIRMNLSRARKKVRECFKCKSDDR